MTRRLHQSLLLAGIFLGVITLRLVAHEGGERPLPRVVAQPEVEGNVPLEPDAVDPLAQAAPTGAEEDSAGDPRNPGEPPDPSPTRSETGEPEPKVLELASPEGGAPVRAKHWSLGFLERWTLLHRPWAIDDWERRTASVEDESGNQKVLRIAPEEATIEELLLRQADDMVLHDRSGTQAAKVLWIDANGVILENADGATARISWSDPWVTPSYDTWQLFNPEIGPLPRQRTWRPRRPRTPNHWFLEREEVADLCANRSTYLRQIRVLPRRDPRTRERSGMQIEALVTFPKLFDLGLRDRDVIKEIDGVPFRSESQFETFLAGFLENGRTELRISRTGLDRVFHYRLTGELERE